MIKSRTYNGQAGLNYIQNPDLAFAKVYVVKREGLQYDKYISGSTNRTYIHQDSLGRINFLNTFAAGGEKVFVIYKPTSGTEPEVIPGVCVPVSIEDEELPDGLVSVPYSESIALTGSEPFTLTENTKPSWMTISLVGSVVTLSGTPDTDGTETIDFDVSNCSEGSTDNFTDNIQIIDNTTNFYISNLSTAGVKITKVIPGHWVIQTGAFPINYLSGITGAHNGFTAFLSVFITGIVFPFQLSLIKNGAALQQFTVDHDDVYEFDEQTFINTDQVQIVLN